MSILTPTRRAVKLHPLAPNHRPDRPFGEGLTVEPLPVNRVAAFLLTAQPEPAVAVPSWTEIEWKRAEYFGLRAPAGMKRPTSPAPIAPPAPAVKASSVTRLDEAWHLGYCLGSDGIDAAPSSRWPADMKASFLDGFAWGEQQRDADLEATAEMYREMETADMPAPFAECYA